MAINFAGGTDRISYQAGWNGFPTGTFAFKLKTTQTTANAVPISIWSSASRTGFGFVLNNTAGKVLLQGYDISAPRIQLLSSTSVNDGNWHSIVFNWNTNNGGANALFVDGVQEATGNSSAAWPIVSTAPLYLGDNNDSFWPSYVGDMAEVAVWLTRQLDAAEIAALGKDISPARIAPGVLNGLTFHAPLVRSPNNRFDHTVTVTGTTVTPHCRLVGGVF
ncbi:LamG domain-containing protein [Mesorhizobium amorphae]|uniref:LamG domain-containing protein n=1 Tax=Mesorhizobium amorphae TaxID=71433 RepID=UPI0017846D13|nr:LamG domain-containing protein [Mesorhizobium amorphae]